MKISIETIPHEDHRYETAGDWLATPAGLQILVSKMSDPRYEFLVGLHETVEAMLCSQAGVSPQTVDEWDMRPENLGLDEPGDDPGSPYHRQHVIASVVERLAAELLGVDWNAYEKELGDL